VSLAIPPPQRYLGDHVANVGIDTAWFLAEVETMSTASTRTLSDGYSEVPDSCIAAVVTTLEMKSRPLARSIPPLPRGLEIRRVAKPDLQWYRRLYRHVGEPWLWFSRLQLSDAALAEIIHDERVAIWSLSAIEPGGELVSDEGLLELDFREAGSCEIAFLGLSMAMTGRGVGRNLMAYAIDEAWKHPIERFWVHTCTLDHPSALGFYMRSGFVAVKRQVEVVADPRLDGTLSPTSAPDVPIIRART
jgi:N-acetylglutamate synthase-like GNAT family acetyltransferase